MFPDVAVEKGGWQVPFEEIKIGKGRKLNDGKDAAILSFGHPGNFAAEAIRDVRREGIEVAHYDMRFAKPLDEEMLHEVFAKFDKIITVEDGTIVGGFGSAILKFMNANGYKADVQIMGLPDRLVEHGTPKELYNEVGIDAAAIMGAIKKLVAVKEKIEA